jgi:hypothetical protein
MLGTMTRTSAPSVDGDDLPDLPALDGEDEHEGLDDPSEIDLGLPEAGDEASDEEPVAATLVDVGLEIGRPAEPSALGDDATGLGDGSSSSTLGLGIDDHCESLVERAEPELGSAGEDADTGLERSNDDTDDTERTDAEGLDDPTGEQLDAAELPELDVGGDDDEVEVGIDIEPLPPDQSSPGPDDAPAGR